jgi:alpha/beta superfamily hydrolase
MEPELWEAGSVWVELVQTRTSDGLRLDGAWQMPPERPNDTAAVDGVMLLHGVGGNFYGSTMMAQLAQALVKLGLPVLRVNTRGHDGVSTGATDQGTRLQGAAYEIVDDCRHDVQAWVRWMQDRHCRRVAVLGHSLGAIKALHAQALQSQPTVARVIAISPPRLAYSRFILGRQAVSFRQSLAAADELIAAGQPQGLFQATFPYPLVLTAATFRDKYGPEERYNFLNLASKLNTPVDFIYGQQELDDHNSAFSGIVQDIEAAPWASAFAISVIPGANHFYAGQWPRLIDEVLKRLHK